jgi:hypothetical protein
MNKIFTAVGCLCTVAVALPVGAGAAATATAKPPHIRQFEYSEDYEGIGRHHSVSATVRGEALRMSARSGTVKADGRLDPVAGPTDYWDFRDHDFVRALLDDLHDDGTATATVKAVGETRTVRKRCSLLLEPDPEFGDYAAGDCKRV